MRLKNLTRQIIPLLVAIFVLTTSVMRLEKPIDKARLFTAGLEYDYIAWTLNAVSEKAGQAQLNVVQRLSPLEQVQVVRRYFELVRELEITRAQIQLVYSDPRVKNPEKEAAGLLEQERGLENSLNNLAALTETILQHQVAQKLKDAGLGFLVNLSLLADLSLEEISRLEDDVADYMNASTLVEDVGGIGVYPTMVQRASSLPWTLDTIAHEWTHNYLTLHPLGLLYDKTPELRTMNETAASIVGSEIGQAVMEQYYPDLVQKNSKVNVGAARSAGEEFDFYHEMHITRVRVDELLAEGKVEEAETFMEARRIIFLQNGYMIRKLNQAYFAFHGAYAEVPEGAAGEDPVGPAVRALRAQAGSLGDFLKWMARMNSFDDLERALNER